MIAENKGHLVTIASMAGHVSTAGLADYCASKFGAVGFDEAIRVELKKHVRPMLITAQCLIFKLEILRNTPGSTPPASVPFISTQECLTA